MAKMTLYEAMTQRIGKQPFDRTPLSKKPFPTKGEPPKHDQSTRGMVPPERGGK